MYTADQWMVPSMANTNTTTSSYWTRQEDKVFEVKIVEIPDGVVDRWHHIARFLPGKSPQEVAAHYEALLEDVGAIEAGLVDTMGYPEEEERIGSGGVRIGSTRKRVEGERKKGRPWTEEEHRNFLRGMDKYGKGDWRSISRNFVISRTPTQVASHAQKYFLRQSQLQKKERKRSSIHDITTGVDTVVVDPPTLPNNHGNPAQFQNVGTPPNNNANPAHFQEFGNPPDSRNDPGHFEDFGNPPDSNDGPGHFQDFGNPPNSHDDPGHFQDFGNPPNVHYGPGHFQNFGNPPNNYDDPGHFQNFGHTMQ